MRYSKTAKKSLRVLLTVMLSLMMAFGGIPPQALAEAAETMAEVQEDAPDPAAQQDVPEAPDEEKPAQDEEKPASDQRALSARDDAVERGVAKKVASEVTSEAGENARPAEVVRALFRISLETLAYSGKADGASAVVAEAYGESPDCAHVAGVFEAVATELGLGCAIVKAEESDACWNLVEVDDLWYHVDAWAAAEELRKDETGGLSADQLETRWLLVGDDAIAQASNVRVGWVVVTQNADEDSIGVSAQSYAWDEAKTDEGGQSQNQDEANAPVPQPEEDAPAAQSEEDADPLSEEDTDSTQPNAPEGEQPLTAQSTSSGTSGTCTWTFNNGTLTISPTNGVSGQLSESTGQTSFPWQQPSRCGFSLDEVKSVVVNSGVSAGTSASCMFMYLSGARTIDISRMDFSRTTDMSYMFASCSSLTNVVFGDPNTSSVQNMAGMFSWCSSLQSLDVSKLDTQNVRDMEAMFCQTGFSTIDLSSFNTSGVTTMKSMFAGCKSLTSVNLSSFNTSNTTDLLSIFDGCSSLESVDLSSFNTRHGPRFYYYAQANDIVLTAFGNCSSLRSFTVGADYDTSIAGAVPDAPNGKWYSTQDGKWYTMEEVKARRFVRDTYTAAGDSVARRPVVDANANQTTTYSGTAKRPTITCSGGTIYYRTDKPFQYDEEMIDILNNMRLGNGVSLSTVLPTRTDAGSLTVYYMAVPLDVSTEDVFGVNKVKRGIMDAENCTVVVGSVTLTISPKSLSSCTATLSPSSYNYDRTQKTPTLTVSDGSKTLVAGTDYTVIWPSGRTSIGTYTVTVTGRGNYTGQLMRSFTIALTDPYNMGDESYSFKNYSDEDSRGGHCFGMSMTSAGYHNGLLDIGVIGGHTGSSLYGFGDNAIVRRPICYYHAIQGPFARSAIVAGGSFDLSLYKSYDIASDWSSVVNYVKSHEYDDLGQLELGYWKHYGGDECTGHSVCFLRYQNVNGQDRLYAYDNNFPTQETYFYMDSYGRVRQAPLQTISGAIDSIELSSVRAYFNAVNNFDGTRVIYMDKEAATVQGYSYNEMKGEDLGDGRVMYVIPEGPSSVTIVPHEDNASITYLGKEFSFGDITEITCAKLCFATPYTSSFDVGLGSGNSSGPGMNKVGAGLSGTGETFTIYESDSPIPTVSLSKTSFTFDGKVHKPTVTVKVGSTVLQESRDYVVEYPAGMVNVGKYEIKVTLKGAYEGQILASFAIVKPAQTITASDKNVALGETASLGAKTSGDGRLSYESSDTSVATVSASGVVKGLKVGTAKVTITAVATSNYSAATKTVTVRVVSDSISGASFSGLRNRGYTGAVNKQVPTVKVGGRTLAKDVDYTLSYYRNGKACTDFKSAGKIVVRATGKGNYGGVAEASYDIWKNGQPMTAWAVARKAPLASVRARDVVVESPIHVAHAVSAAKPMEYRKVGGDSRLNVELATGRVTVRKGTPAGTYKVKIRAIAFGGANYADGSRTVECTVRVVSGKLDQDFQVSAADVTRTAASLVSADYVTRPFKVAMAAGKVTYRRASGSGCLDVDSAGRLRIKRGTPKGTYTATVSANAAGDAGYRPCTRTVTVKVVVR